MSFKNIIIFISLTLLHLFSGAQINLQSGGNNGKEALAIQFFEQREYEKANVYLEDLFDKNPTIW